MKREELIEQVKEEYANIAADSAQQHFNKTTTGITPEEYYRELLSAVIDEINEGTFDNCRSGREIVNKVSVDKSLLSD